MEVNISLVETDQIEDKIKIVLGQTDYSPELAREKLKEHGYNEIATIKSYLGITEKKNQSMKSVNQEIYRQLRTKLDTNMRDYKIRVENGEAKQIS
jgi:glutamine synthetase type III